MVSPTNATSYPGTVMVHSQHTCAARAAVMGTFGPLHSTGSAPSRLARRPGLLRITRCFLFCILLPLLHRSAPFASSCPVDPLGARGCAGICQSCLQITPDCQQPGRVEHKHPHRRRLGKFVEGQPLCEEDAPHYQDAASGHTPCCRMFCVHLPVRYLMEKCRTVCL